MYGSRTGNPEALSRYRMLEIRKEWERINLRGLWHEAGEEQRKFKLGFDQRNKIISAAKFGFDCKENNILFLTATFQEGEFESKDDPRKHPNTVLVKWLDNLRHNYDAGGYAWTKELTEKKTPHYHILIEMPYQKIKALNDSFCKARGYYSPNAVRHDPKNGLVVKSWEKSAGYAAKYISKCKDVIYFNRCYAIANKWAVPAVRFQKASEIDYILRNSVPVSSKFHSIKTDFAEIFKINPGFTKELFQSVI